MSQESEIRVKEATSASENKGVWKWKEGDMTDDSGMERRVIGRGRRSGYEPIANIVETWKKGRKSHNSQGDPRESLGEPRNPDS